MVGCLRLKGFEATITNLGGNQGGAKVERIPTLLRDPGRVNLQELLDAAQQLVSVEVLTNDEEVFFFLNEIKNGETGKPNRKSEPLGRRLHALHVLVGPEEADLVVLVLVGLHSLEELGEEKEEENPSVNIFSTSRKSSFKKK